jgi:soluble lytic murein transglycosylase-like protein
MPELFTKEQAILPYVLQSAQQYNVPAALILGHIAQESNFKADAYRAEPSLNDGSTGLMQLLLQTAKSLDSGATQEKLYDPAYNITLGTAYIAKNMARYPGDIPSAIAAYNAGTAYKDSNGNYISKSGNDVQYYVNRVTNFYNKYTEWLAGGSKTIEFGWPDFIIALVLSGFVVWLILRKKDTPQITQTTPEV